MQPRPMAETVKSLLPSLRVRISDLLGRLAATDGRSPPSSSPPRAHRLFAVFLVADLFHPVDILAVKKFRNSDMRHRSGGSRAMPVLLAWWKPNDVARTDLFDWPAFGLRPTKARRDNQGLAERMGVPRGTGARLEGDVTAAHTWWVANLEHWVYADGAGKIGFGSFA